MRIENWRGIKGTDDPLRERRRYIDESLFAGRYEVLRTLHENAASRVFLVRHKELDCLRVLKCIGKNGDTTQRNAEAAMLQDLRHPGIPVLYDYTEDGNTIFIVEEYVRGQSLAEYMLCRQISQRQLIDIAVRILDILRYLHTRKPVPIVYQDMKPEHIFLEGDAVRLVDYGIAAFLTGSGTHPETYGTKSYASPEQLRGSVVDARADLYSLALVLKELMTHTETPVSFAVRRTVKKALSEDPSRRPSSAEAWALQWQRLSARGSRTYRMTKRAETDHQRTIIAVVGNEESVGTTHIAVSLCVWLNRGGTRAVYVSRDGRQLSVRLRQNSPVFKTRDDLIYHGGFTAVRSEGAPNERGDMPEPHGEITVWDAGHDVAVAAEADLILYVIGSRLWQYQEGKKSLLLRADCVPVINPASFGAGYAFGKAAGRRVFLFPYDKDPFALTRAKARFFRKVFGELGAAGL